MNSRQSSASPLWVRPLVIIVRGVDISVGAMMGFAATLAAFIIPDYGISFSLIIPLVACGVLGLANGLLIEKGGIPPIVATIGMMWVIGGLAGSISNGRLIPIADETFRHIFTRKYLRHHPTVLCRPIGDWSKFSTLCDPISLLGDTSMQLAETREPQYYSALPVKRLRIAVYGVAGVLYGVAGLLMASYVRSGMPGLGKGYEFKAITAAVLGGIVLSGGQGNIFKAVLGAIILIVLFGVITAFSISPYIQGIVQGCVLVGAVYYATRNN